MRGSEERVIDVGALLEKVEAAAPIDAVEAVAVTLGEMLAARSVTLLIADFSGRALVRLTSSSRGIEGARTQGVEHAETLPLGGTLYERVLRTQQADVREVDDATRVTLPVTDRGDAIG
ncbi:MAG: serine/threonine-protein phosphatase, partial [Blastococcus sp.]